MKTSRTIRPLALPAGRQAVAAGARCSLAGWGLTHQNGPLARALQELDLRVLDARMCNNSRFWDGAITPRMLCLEAPSKGQGPCKVTRRGRFGEAGGRQPVARGTPQAPDSPWAPALSILRGQGVLEVGTSISPFLISRN